MLKLAAAAQLMLCLSHLAAADLLDCNHLVIFCHLLLQATLESSLEALNVKKFDLAFAVDPLFHKTSAQFDEGGARGEGRRCKWAVCFYWSGGRSLPLACQGLLLPPSKRAATAAAAHPSMLT